MAILKDTEREQLRQLVKACLLEISKLKIDLKKCQKESRASIKTEKERFEEINEKILELERVIKENETEINKLKVIIADKDDKLVENEKIRLYFDALTARPKKDLTSFQSQVYQLLSTDKSTAEDHYHEITEIAFKELSMDNFQSVLRNLERKGYVKSYREDGMVFWKKIEK